MLLQWALIFWEKPWYHGSMGQWTHLKTWGFCLYLGRFSCFSSNDYHYLLRSDGLKNDLTCIYYHLISSTVLRNFRLLEFQQPRGPRVVDFVRLEKLSICMVSCEVCERSWTKPVGRVHSMPTFFRALKECSDKFCAHVRACGMTSQSSAVVWKKLSPCLAVFPHVQCLSMFDTFCADQSAKVVLIWWKNIEKLKNMVL